MFGKYIMKKTQQKKTQQKKKKGGKTQKRRQNVTRGGVIDPVRSDRSNKSYRSSRSKTSNYDHVRKAVQNEKIRRQNDKIRIFFANPRNKKYELFSEINEKNEITYEIRFSPFMILSGIPTLKVAEEHIPKYEEFLEMVREGEDITNSDWVKFVNPWWNSEMKKMEEDALRIDTNQSYHP
jgi:hypothetical protein